MSPLEEDLDSDIIAAAIASIVAANLVAVELDIKRVAEEEQPIEEVLQMSGLFPAEDDRQQ